jgi:transposase
MTAVIAFLGVDVAKLTLDGVVRIATAEHPPDTRLPHKKFSNSEEGFADMLTWACRKAQCEPAGLRVILEPTVAYHLGAARAFHDAGCEVILANPYRVREFAVGIGQMNKTDKADATVLTWYGSEARSHSWQPPPPEIAELHTIVKRLYRLDRDIQREDSRREVAVTCKASGYVMESLSRVQAFQYSERKILLEAIEEFVGRHATLLAERDLLLTISGVGPVLACHLLCLLRGRPFSSARQAAALAGVVPLRTRSGKTTFGRTRMSKAGDPMLRHLLYMPALGLLKQPETRAIYARLVANRKHHPLQAIVALMRRTIHVAFGVLKHQRPYDPQWYEHSSRPVKDATAAAAAAERNTVDGIATSAARIPKSYDCAGANTDVRFNVRCLTLKSGFPVLAKTKARANTARQRKLRTQGSAATGNSPDGLPIEDIEISGQKM